MSVLVWIIFSGLLMSAISLIGSLTLLLKPNTLKQILIPLAAFSAGSLIGAAFFHMIPAAIAVNSNSLNIGIALVSGFAIFFILEQFLHWHHCHLSPTHC